MTRPPDPDELLFPPSHAYRTLSFHGEPPIEHHGLRVVSKRTTQDTDDKGNLRFWPKGGEIWVIIYGLQLPPGYRPDARIIEEYGDDDGIRYWWVRVANMPPNNAYTAVQEAVKRARRKKVDIDGVFDRLAFVRWGARPPGGSPRNTLPKEYEAAYTPAPDRADDGGAVEAPEPDMRKDQREPARAGARGAPQADPYANVPPPDDEPPF